MSFESAVRATEILLGLAFIQQSLEHLRGRPVENLIFGPRIFLCICICIDVGTTAALACLLVFQIAMLQLFQGPYNGGSDRMGGLVLLCLTTAHVAPGEFWQHAAFAYLAAQLLLSYFISGKVKLANPQWRSGQALSDVFAFSAYPVSENMRKLETRRGLLRPASLAVIGFEILFPLFLLSPLSLWLALVIGAVFHFANAILFGLNRFLWVWISAYPSVLWLQSRIIG